MIKTIRRPAVAGTFYPDDPVELRATVAALLNQAARRAPAPKALIVPHAGYIYSGPVAASGYALLDPVREQIERVVLLGPAHRVPFYGLAASSADEFATPLGNVPVDRSAVEMMVNLPQVQVRDDAHQPEHSLEVQLPFLQVVLGDFMLVPFVVGQAQSQQVAQVIERLWTDEQTLVVISSDLSHYHDYWTARAIDQQTSAMIEALDWSGLSGERACGYLGIAGLLQVAQSRGLRVETIDLRNSGDTAGPKDQVVGYGSYAIF